MIVVRGDSMLQLQAFAAPKRAGLWDDIRRELIDELNAAGGRGEEAEGPFGPEVRARVPAEPGDRGTGMQPARFLGADGPRWFLRGVDQRAGCRPAWRRRRYSRTSSRTPWSSAAIIRCLRGICSNCACPPRRSRRSRSRWPRRRTGAHRSAEPVRPRPRDHRDTVVGGGRDARRRHRIGAAGTRHRRQACGAGDARSRRCGTGGACGTRGICGGRSHGAASRRRREQRRRGRAVTRRSRRRRCSGCSAARAGCWTRRYPAPCSWPFTLAPATSPRRCGSRRAPRFAIFVYRLVRRDTLRHSVGGFIGVAVAAGLAVLTGKPENYFLPALGLNVAYAMAAAVSLAVRWPLIGLVLGAVFGEGTEWRRDPARRRAYTAATALWLGHVRAAHRRAVPALARGPARAARRSAGSRSATRSTRWSSG